MKNNENARLAQVEEILATIVERNRKVELEKSWETSLARKITIVVLTYALMCLMFYMLESPNYFSNATVPTLGYFLSTLSLPLIKKEWIKRKSTLRVR